MKYVIFWEHCPEVAEKLIEKTKKLAELTEKEPKKWPKSLFPGHYYGWCKGLTIVEAEQEHITRSMAYWFPEMKMVYKPLIANIDIMKEYLELKK